jgi:Fe-S cluster biogenesis protein NfuA
MMATTSDISGNIIKQTVKRALEEVLKEKVETTNESQNKLWDKDKLILIFYIGIGDLKHEKAYEILQNISNELEEMFDESVKPIIMPVRDGGDIRVEPIYMQTITNNEDNNRLTETINKLEQAVKDLYDTQIA